MKTKEFEKILKKSAQAVKPRPFFAIWGGLKNKIPQESRVLFPTWAKAVVATSLSFIIICSVLIPIVLKNKSYDFSELTQVLVNEEVFYEEMNRAKISTVDVSEYFNKSFTLYKTRGGKALGGEVSFSNKKRSKDYYVSIKFLSKKVEYAEYDGYEFVNQLKVGEYSFYQTQENYILEEDAYISYVKGNYKGENCFMRMGIVLYSSAGEEFWYQNYNAEKALGEIFT